jgi:hypothetical protein
MGGLAVNPAAREGSGVRVLRERGLGELRKLRREGATSPRNGA